MSAIQEQGKFILRFPAGMHAEIKSAAAANGRSMNSEILYRLGAWTEGSQPAEVTQVAVTLATVRELEAAADRAFVACQRLGIRIERLDGPRGTLPLPETGISIGEIDHE